MPWRLRSQGACRLLRAWAVHHCGCWACHLVISPARSPTTHPHAHWHPPPPALSHHCSFQGNGASGAGDLLLGLLGLAYTHTGFVIYQHREQLLNKTVLAACLGSAAFSILSTVVLVKALGIASGEALKG